MTLTPEQHRIYFEARLSGQSITETGRDVSVRCPFHDDRQASMSLHVEKGVWKCHAGCGILEFEMRFSGCDAATAWANLGNLCGVKNQNMFRQQPEASYPYVNEDGALLFEKLPSLEKSSRSEQRTQVEHGPTNLMECERFSTGYRRWSEHPT